MICAGVAACDRPLLPLLETAALDSFQRTNCARLDDVRASLYDHDPGKLATIYLKIAFPVERRGVRDEMMWVQVVTWTDDQIEGVLVNEPTRRRDLHAGSYVAFGPERIVDYQQDHRDGTRRGNALRVMLQGGLVSPRTILPSPAGDGDSTVLLDRLR
jgi:uncharacterized protein YegJ (DUF2314 family)